ncbi:inositol monophosphatase family protein [Actinoplanes palleronii]|uniref:inositol-phosphate phosphatase n=1 Tax=Actinoplanes palleronii TaxID=113570 RepID=A0ABQ4BE70_9ACTN|nr:inositol monophosphatase family protein [Actinoplanes palleronii]GIE68939.1 inositol monophosphatase [Actinoplanes palleronii]
MTSTVQHLIDVAAQSAVDAGRLIRHRFRGPIGTSTKQAAHDVVTTVDLAAEESIRAALRGAAPHSSVVGEEGGATIGAGDPVWLVDPIDGTYNFVRGIPFFCVSIGLRIAGRTVGGCVYDPIHEELFTAADGRAWLNGTPLPTRTSEPPAPPLVLCDIPNAGGPPAAAETDLLAALLTAAADVRRLGSSALALAYVAAGRADLAANADVYDWDTAAGRALVTATGGGYLSHPDPLPTLRRGSFVAWAPAYEALGRSVGGALHRDHFEETV